MAKNKGPIDWVLRGTDNTSDIEKYGFTKRNRNKRLAEIYKIIRKHRLTKGVSPEGLRLLLEDLGPTFVKIGQVLSMRSEILPKKYCDELTKLRADVRPLPYEVVLATLQREYDRPLEEIFAHIDEKPNGSASVAQVHRATLVTGEDVAIKVQRPGVQEVMAQDISIMRSIVHTVMLFSNSEQIIDLEDVVEELWQTFKEETDFLQEAANLDEFARRNADVKYISCPKAYHELCTEHVVVMEYVEGINIGDTDALIENGYDLQEIGNKLVDNYTRQVLDDGFFHGDPHPGNIIIRGGQIVYIDLGMMGYLSARDRKYLGQIIFAVGEQDIPKLKSALFSFAVDKDTSRVDHAQFLDDLDGIVELFGTMDLKDFDIGGFLGDLFSLASRSHVVLPSSSSMISKGFVTLEGVLDECLPETNLIEIITNHASSDYSKDKILEKEAKDFLVTSKVASRSLLKGGTYFAEFMKMLTRGQLKFNMELTGSEVPLKTMGDMVDRIAMSVIIAGLFVGSSIVYMAEIKPLIFGIPILGFLGYLGAFVLSVWVVWDIWKTRRHHNKNF